jgi:hypothetical protein
MKHFEWTHFQAIVGNNSIWREAASTLRQLSQLNALHMNPDVHFPEPYIGPDDMPKLLDDTYQQTRGKCKSTLG